MLHQFSKPRGQGSGRFTIRAVLLVCGLLTAVPSPHEQLCPPPAPPCVTDRRQWAWAGREVEQTQGCSAGARSCWGAGGRGGGLLVACGRPFDEDAHVLHQCEQCLGVRTPAVAARAWRCPLCSLEREMKSRQRVSLTRRQREKHRLALSLTPFQHGERHVPVRSEFRKNQGPLQTSGL